MQFAYTRVMSSRLGNRTATCRRRTLFALSFSFLAWSSGTATASPARQHLAPYWAESGLLRAKPSPYGALPNPFTAQSSPYRTGTHSFAAKLNPYGACANPFTAKPNPYGARPNPFTAKPNPYGAWPNPFTLRLEMSAEGTSALFAAPGGRCIETDI